MKKIKKSILILILILFITVLFYGEDNSTDSQERKTTTIKFRGGIYLPMAWYFSYDPTKATDHISLPSYSYEYDYTDEGDPNFKHHSKDDDGSEISSSDLSGKISLGTYFSIIAPFLKFDHFLLNDNNINLTFSTDITPVSIKTSMDISITPVAFLTFDAGAQIGTGWNIPGLGAGLARNNYSGVHRYEDKDILMKDSLYGPVFKNWFSAALQLDISSIIDKPYKRWTHVVMSAAPSFECVELLNYSYYERTFYWELDNTFNGWTFSCDFMLGYKIPVIEDSRKEEAEEKMFMGYVRHNNFTITGVMWVSLSANVTHYNDSPMKDHGWGSDFVTCKFGPNIMFDLPNNFSFIIGVHWSNGMVYSSDSVGNNDFHKWEYKDWNIFFDELAWSFSWDF